MNKRRIVKLAQRAVWDIEATGLESMPLATSYLKAFAYKDADLRKELDIEICNFGGSSTSLDIVRSMVVSNPPDMVCFSVFGWNLNLFGNAVETYRQFRPEGWVVFGGPHVTDQAARIFRMYPEVDVIVNYEGEITFSEVLKSYLAGKSKNDLAHIDGISFKGSDGRVIDTPRRDRILNLDEIPSPFLTGAMPLTKSNGDFRYDVVLMETNRGCPNHCAYCFWGGAVGQRVSYFSIDRLAAEIELFARLHVMDVCLCDANFGMNKHDEEFLEAVIRAKEKHGYPKRIVVSWARAKNRSFYRMLERMDETRVGTSFSLSLQSLHAPVLEIMERKNMEVEDWRRLCAVTRKNDLELYGELMWGLPGETCESFVQGYDRLSREVPRIAIYPLLLLPNTKYSAGREELGIKTWRAGKDDFEYVLAHNTMSFADNQEMHRFIFWARVFFEYPFFRYIMYPLQKLANISQSRIIYSLDDWIDKDESQVSMRLRDLRRRVVDSLDAYNIECALHYIYQEPGIDTHIQTWWEAKVLPLVPSEYVDFFVELMKYDLLTRPIWGSNAKERDGRTSQSSLDGYPTIMLGNEEYYVRRSNPTAFDIPGIVGCIVEGSQCTFQPSQRAVTLYYKVGFSDYVSNHEFYRGFFGKTEQQLAEEAARDEL